MITIELHLLPFLSAAVGLSAEALQSAWTEGPIIPAALEALDLYVALDGKTGVHLPSGWRNARQFGGSAPWKEALLVSRIAVEQEEDERLLVSASSKSPLPTAAPQNAKRALALFLITKIEEATAEGLQLHLFRNRIQSLFPRNVVVILFDRIAGNKKVDPKWIDLLVRLLEVDKKTAARVVHAWQVYRGAAPFQLLSPEEWELGRTPLIQRMEARLEEEAAKRTGLSLSLVEKGINPGHPYAGPSFHNVLMSGNDRPRESSPALQIRFFGKCDYTQSDTLKRWDAFWTRMAEKFGWKTKPIGRGRFHEMDSLLRYAKTKPWSLLKFVDAFDTLMAQHPERQFIVTVFNGLLDREVLNGTHGIPRERPTLDEMMRQDGTAASDHGRYLDWMHRLEPVIQAVGPHALRPLKEHAARLRRRRSLGKTREYFFKKAAAKPLDGFNNRSLLLHHLLTQADLDLDALAAANIIEGIQEGVRQPTDRLSLGGYKKQAHISAENRVEVLAHKYGFPLKPKHEASVKRSRSRKLGVYMKTVLEKAENESWQPEQMKHFLRTDPPFRSLAGKNAEAVAELFVCWTDRHLGRDHRTKNKIQAEVAAAHSDLFRETFAGWWKRFEQWRKALGWFETIPGAQ